MWHDSEDRLGKAVERFEEGAIEAARLMLRNLDRRGVISPRIDLYLGHCHLEAEEYRAAIRRYRRCVSLAPDSPAPWIGLGLCYGRLGHLDRAIDAFHEALRRGPEIEEVHCNLTHCYALAGDLDRARQHARRAATLDPQCPHVHRHLALAFLIADEPERSLQAWRRVSKLAPDHPELPVGVGRAFVALGRRTEARRNFLAALDGPFAADARFGLGDLARDEGDLDGAADHYARALEEDAEFGEARLRLSESLGEVGRVEEAWEVLRPLHDDRGDQSEVIALSARLLHARGRRAHALRLLRAWVAARRQEPAAWTQLGAHLCFARRYRAAASVLRSAHRHDPGDPEAARLLARALGRMGDGRRAVSVLARAAHRHPADEELHLDVAAALLARGRRGAAERALLRGLSWNPEAAGLWAAAAEVALEDGRLPLARARLRSALRRDRRHRQALALLVRWLLRSGYNVRAAHAARAALRVAASDDEVVRDHGHALLACGRPEEALLSLRRYVLAAPSDPGGYRLLAEAMEALGDRGAARMQRRLSEMVVAGV